MTDLFRTGLNYHYKRIKNENDEVLSEEVFNVYDPYLKSIRFSFNCDVEKAGKCFEAEVQKSDTHIQEVFKKQFPEERRLQEAASNNFFNSILILSVCADSTRDSTTVALVALREDFDLKASSLSKWKNDGFTC